MVPFEDYNSDNQIGPDGISANHLDDQPDNRDGKGAIITVTYRVASGQHAMCTQGPVTQRYRIGIAGGAGVGQARPIGDRAALVDIPVANGKCNYVATWVESFDYIWRLGTPQETRFGDYTVSGNGWEFNADTEPIRVQYSLVREFEPAILITVPDDERPGSPGTSLYTDLDFKLRVRPTAESPDGCTEVIAGDVEYGVESGKLPSEFTVEVQSSGDVTWVKDAPSLIDVPQGAQTGERCEYRIWYPPVLTSAEGGTGDWTLVLQGGRTDTVHANKAAAEKVYLNQPATPSFIPDVRITIPFILPPATPQANRNVLGNATIFAEYAPTPGSPAGCTDSDFDYFYANNQRTGSSTTTNAWPPHNAPARASLVSMPAGQTTPCRYVATFQPHLSAGEFGPFPIVSGQGFEFSSGERVSAVYADATPFEPMLSFTVSPAPSGGAMSAHAGGVIAVPYAKTATSSTSCSRDGVLRYVIGSDGLVSPASGAPSLISTVGDQSATPCAYDVTFPSTVSSAPGAASPWVLRLGGGATTETVSEAMASHSRTLTAVDAFAPDVSISVPPIDVTIGGASKNLFADVLTSAPGASARYGPVTFRVEFDRSGGPTSGCSDVGATYTVQDDGSVTGDAPALIDRLTPGGTQCVYAVMFPTTGLLGGLMKATDSTDDDEVMGGATGAAATYANTVFDGGVLSVDVTTPGDADTGRTVDVTLTRAATASAECGARESGFGSFDSPASLTVPLDVDGSTSVDPAFDYVDFPAGATSAADRCVYTVSWSDTDEVTSGSSLWQRHSGTTTFTGAGRANPTGALAATYAVGPPSEVPLDATLTMRLSSRIPASTTFSVTVRPAASQHSMCSTAQPTVTFTAPQPNTDGSDAVLAETVTGLVGQPADVAARCEYVVAWPMNETSGTLYIQDPDFAQTTTLNIDAATAAQRYIADVTTFDATLRLVTAPGVPAGTAFEVTVAREPGSHMGCTSENRPVTLTAAANPGGSADASATVPIAGLVDFPAGATAPCVYVVGWLPEATVGGVAYIRDSAYADYSTTLSAEPTTARTAAARYLPAASAETTLPVTFDVRAGADGPPANTRFSVRVAPAAGSPAGCTDETFDVFVDQSNPKNLIDSPLGETGQCTYTVTWPPNEKDGTLFIEDPSYASQKTLTLDADNTSVSNQYVRRVTPTVNPQVSPGGTNPAVSAGGGTSRRPSTGGGGSGGRASGGGSSSGGSSGGAATGPWVVAATSRVPVTVSLAMPERDFPVGTAIEVMLNVPGTCGDDTTAFAGLTANIGLVYALTAQSGTTADVLAAGALALAGYAQRGDDTRDCEVRITLITAPAGCRLQSTAASTSADSAVSTDDAGRSYVELTGGQSTTSYSATPALVCS